MKFQTNTILANRPETWFACNISPAFLESETWTPTRQSSLKQRLFRRRISIGQPTVEPRVGWSRINFKPLDPRNIRLEQIAGLIFASVMMTGLLIALLVVWLNLGLGWILYLVTAVILTILLILFLSAWLWPPLAHRHSSWRLDTEGLEIRRGVLWRHQITIPLGRVQHADVSQGPFQRYYDLGTLTVHTAGTQNASVEVPGLAHTTAIALRDLIVQQRKDQHVV